MQCRRCDRSLPDRAVVCPECGTRIPDSDLPTEDFREPGPRPAAVATRRPDLAPGSRFAGRFTIVEKIGEGGMGIVYKAIDTQLDLPVALKMIRPAVAHHAGTVELFKDEVRIARQISHRNVSRVHDLGEIDGQVYLSMEWIQGETLRQLLKRAGSLEQDRALQVAADIALALEAAHSVGIIHRDLKPENVMIDERGDVHVVDFGIAVLEEAQGRLARAGAFGTPGYMAPEQGRGERLDARADLYALGLILVEMLTGSHPAQGGRTPSLHRSAMPRGLAAILEGLLAEDRDQRPSSAGAVAAALSALRASSNPIRWGRRLALWTLIAVIGAGGTYLALRARRPHRPNGPSAIAGGPPTAIAGSPAQVFYERGIDYLRNRSETMLGLEAAINMLHRSVEEDPQQAPAWAALGEAYWRRFERNAEASSRDEAASAVSRAIQIQADLPEAINALGRGLLAMGKNVEARREFERAVAVKPGFDDAWANLGIACQEITGGYAEGLKAFQRAIALNPTYFRHWIYLGLFHERFAEWDEAAKAYRKAAELKPDSIASWNNLGGVLLRLNREDEAVQAFERSLGIQQSAESHTNLGNALYYAGRYSEAAGQYRKATAISPRGAVYWKNLGDAETMLGRSQEARDAYMRARNLARERALATPLDPQSHRQLGLLCAKTGDEKCALKEGDRAMELAPGDAPTTFANSAIRCLLGRQDEALDLLERAVRLGLARQDIENDPDLRPLHALPRYKRIVELAG